jgi:hypothetical protein
VSPVQLSFMPDVGSARRLSSHRAVVNVPGPFFERRYIFDSYAFRRGSGTHRAIQRLQCCLRNYESCLKTSLSKFFPFFCAIQTEPDRLFFSRGCKRFTNLLEKGPQHASTRLPC